MGLRLSMKANMKLRCVWYSRTDLVGYKGINQQRAKLNTYPVWCDSNDMSVFTFVIHQGTNRICMHTRNRHMEGSHLSRSWLSKSNQGKTLERPGHARASLCDAPPLTRRTGYSRGRASTFSYTPHTELALSKPAARCTRLYHALSTSITHTRPSLVHHDVYITVVPHASIRTRTNCHRPVHTRRTARPHPRRAERPYEQMINDHVCVAIDIHQIT